MIRLPNTVRAGESAAVQRHTYDKLVRRDARGGVKAYGGVDADATRRRSVESGLMARNRVPRSCELPSTICVVTLLSLSMARG